MTGTAPLQGTGYGSGKILLLGEHTVVHGHTALAAGIPQGVTARARVSTERIGRLIVPNWNIDIPADDPGPVGQALRRVQNVLFQPPVDILADATLPARAGLGSSASFATAVARALAILGHACDRGDDAIDRAVAAAEQVFHGNPSGVDAAAAKHGGVGRFSRSTGWIPLTLPQPLKICVGLSGQIRHTHSLVEKLRVLMTDDPRARSRVDALGALAEAGAAEVLKVDPAELGMLFTAAQEHLAALGLSTPTLDQLVAVANGAGADGAKLTGAGGGGAVIAWAPGFEEAVLAAWKQAGFEGFVSTLGTRTP